MSYTNKVFCGIVIKNNSIKRGGSLKRYIGSIIVLVFYLIFNFGPSIVHNLGGDFGNNDIEITSYDAVVTFNDAGDMHVVERWDMVYNESMRVRFRDIVYDKYGDGYPLYKDIANVATFDEENVEIRFYKDGVNRTDDLQVGYSFDGDRDELGELVTCYPYVAYCESLFADTIYAGRMEGNVTFVYDYTIEGVVTQYSDISEINWRLFTYAEATVETAHVEVNLPSNTYDTSDVLVWGHGLSNGTIYPVSNDQVVMDMSDIKDGEFIEFRILMENSLFPNIESRNVVITSEMNKQILMDYEAELAEYYNTRIQVAQTLEYASIALIVVMLGIGIVVYIKIDKEFVSDFDGDYYRELPNEDRPVVVGYLYFMEKMPDEVVTATLLDLIRRKHILMKYHGSDMSENDSNFYLEVNPEGGEDELITHEIKFMDLLFHVIGKGNTVTTDEIKDYGKISESKAIQYQSELKTFMRLSKKTARSKNYFISSYKMNKNKILLLNIIPILFGLYTFYAYTKYNINILIPLGASIASVVAYSIYVTGIKKRTREGNELYAKWKAFKNFLEDFSNMEDYPIPGIIVWEHYLVYATVFKIADKVMKQLEVKLPKEAVEQEGGTFLYGGYGRHRYYRYGMYHHFNNSFRTASSNARSTIASAKAARAAARGSGGGFGGGSSFGGGGGGGRSR